MDFDACTEMEPPVAGFEAASMDRIAVAAEVTKQTDYRYFPSKIDLFEETIRFVGQSSGADFLHHLEVAPPPRGLGSVRLGVHSLAFEG